MTWGVSVGAGEEKTETDTRYSVRLGREDEAAVGTEQHSGDIRSKRTRGTLETTVDGSDKLFQILLMY